MSDIPRRDPLINEAIEILDRHWRRSKFDYAIAFNTLGSVERQFIRQELKKCVLSPRYYLENYHTIQTEDEGFKTLYPFWDSQEIFFNEIMSMVKAAVPVKIVVLKARQLGLSTISEGLIFHRTIFNRAINSLIVAQDPGQSAYLFDMFTRAYDNLPWWMQPEKLFRSKGRYMVFATDKPDREGLNSQIMVESANKLCLCPGTMVETRRGLVPIEEIKPGDQVFGPTCRPVEVVAAIARSSPKKTGKKITLWHNAAFPISGTDGHPLMTTTGLRNMEEIKAGDSLVLPFRRITSEKIIPLAEMTEWAKVRLQSKPMPVANREWGFLCGLYLAEGTVGKDKGRCVSFGLHTREMGFAERASRACGVKLGEPTIYGNGMICRIHSSWLGTWLSQQFGDNNEKRIPDWVFGCGPEFCVGLLEGMILGDGHKCKYRNDIVFITVRPMLALKIRELSLALGFGLPGIMKSKTSWEWRGVKKAGVAYRVEFGNDVGIAVRLALGMAHKKTRRHHGNRPKWNWIDGKNAVAVKVRSVEDCPIDIVYDIQVDSEDHLYTLPACITHNTGVSVGKTIRAGHLSELSAWDDPTTLTEQIFPTMNAKDELAIMESTARGRSGTGKFWYDFWNNCVNKWGDGLWEWKPVFIEWFRCSVSTIDKNAKVGKYARSTTGTEFVPTADELAFRAKVQRDTPDHFTIPDEMLKWRRYKIDETIAATGDAYGFTQEYPATHQESFISSGTCAFPRDLLNRIMATDCCDPDWVGEIEYHHDAQIKFRTHLTDVRDKRRKEPGWGIPSTDYTGGRLRIWEKPMPGEAYYIGADIAHGIEGRDYSCAQVIRIGRGGAPDEQVAEWHGWISPTPFGDVLAALGYYYNTCEVSSEINDCGQKTYMQLFRILGYPQLFRWKHYDRVKNFYSDLMAWQTTSKTRPLLITNMRERLMDGVIKLHSYELLDEMFTFASDDDGGRFEGQDNHDDTIFAAMICLWCAHDSDYGQQAEMSAPVGSSGYFVVDGRGCIVEQCHKRNEDTKQLEPLTRDEATSYMGKNPTWSIRRQMVKRDLANSEFSPVHDRQGPRATMHYEMGVPAEHISGSNLIDAPLEDPMADWRSW